MNPHVLIVGAGPVGLTLALELARYRVPVTLVDKITARETSSRAVAVWPRTLELLDRAGAAADLLALGNRVSCANIVAGSHTLARIELGGVASPYPFALMIPQDRTEAVLERHVVARGITPQLGVELVDVDQDAHGVTATWRQNGVEVAPQRFDWLVACDGAHSVVRHKLGMAFDGETLDTDWVQGDFLLEGMPFPASELGIYWHGDGVLLFFPMGPNRFRVIASRGHAAQGDLPLPDVAAFQQLVDRRGPGGVRLKTPLWISKFKINERQVNDYRASRVFLAGDAAHVHSPAGGQGMNTGMQDAINLAWKMAMACHGRLPADMLLDSYDAERRPVGAEVIRAAGRLTKVATVEGPHVQHVRNLLAHALLGLAPVQHAMADQMTELSTAYPDSPLTMAHPAGKLSAGMRMPPVPGERPYGAGDRPRFSLRSNDPGARVLIERFPHLLESSLRPGPEGGDMQLVRPDGYLAAAVSRPHANQLADYLQCLASGLPVQAAVPAPANPGWSMSRCAPA
ncbi:FAD-dependent oxidoreductase [Variovorax sp. KK3]|uniref:FAD-dependent oxidoreductase n=1 Tax=Variovorax sp. KK3 TaxID=1855728 RepID=UPI0009F957C4|nr:FAD-dependent oxidoreductase [Variovorax sp. KK3]